MKVSRFAMGVATLAVCVALIFPGGALAEVLAVFTSQVNSTLSTIGYANMVVFVPGGSQVVYQARVFDADSYDLFSVPSAGGAQTNLSRIQTDAADVSMYNFEISPNGARVVFLGDLFNDGVTELYSAPVNGSAAPVRLNTPLPAGRNVSSYKISPDSTKVTYVANQDSAGLYELYIVPIAGGTVTKLNNAPLNGQNVANSGGVQFTSDSANVVYMRQVNSRLQLFSVPVGGGTVTDLSSSVNINGDVQAGFVITPDNTTVVYRANAGGASTYELYRAAINGSSVPTKMHASISVSSTISLFRLSPNASEVYFIGDLDVPGTKELYSVPINATNSTVPTDLLGLVPTGRQVHTFSVNANSPRIVFVSDLETAGKFEVFSMIPSGAGYTRISGDMSNANGDVEYGASAPLISPDGNRVVYMADGTTDGQERVYSTLISSKSAVDLSPSPVTFGEIFNFTITANSATVVLRGDYLVNDVYDILSVPIAGGSAPVKLNPNNGQSVFIWAVSPDSSRVAFIVFNGSGQHVYSNLIGGGGLVQLSSALAGGDVIDYAVTPNNQYAVYLADADIDNTYELYCFNTVASTTTKQHADLGVLRDITNFALTPDNTRVVAVGDLASNDVFELFSAPICSSSGVNLSGSMVLNGDVDPGLGFKISPNSQWVVYAADQTVDGRIDLYSAPAAGGSPAVLLSSGSNANRTIVKYAISPDSNRVYFIADLNTDEVYELFTVPIGGGVVTRINGTLVASGDVTDFVMSSDFGSVIYRADQVVDDNFGLFKATLPSWTVTQLWGQGGPNQSAEADFVINWDNTYLLFRSDFGNPGQYKLYSLPLDGSGPATVISLPLVANGDVVSFQVNAVGAQVVYMADGDVDEKYELYSASVRGRGAFPLITGMANDRDVASDWLITPDGSQVVYRSNFSSIAYQQVWRVPISGGNGTLVSFTPVAGGSAVAFSLSPDGGRLAYLSDQETDNVFELYTVPTLGQPQFNKLNPAISGLTDVTAPFRLPNMGNSYYLIDTPVDESFYLYRAFDSRSVQSIFGFALPTGKYVSESFNLNVTASSSQSTELYSASPSECKVNITQVTILGTGRCTIVAWQRGTQSGWLPAPPVAASAMYTSRTYLPVTAK